MSRTARGLRFAGSCHSRARPNDTLRVGLPATGQGRSDSVEPPGCRQSGVPSHAHAINVLGPHVPQPNRLAPDVTGTLIAPGSAIWLLNIPPLSTGRGPHLGRGLLLAASGATLVAIGRASEPEPAVPHSLRVPTAAGPAMTRPARCPGSTMPAPTGPTVSPPRPIDPADTFRC